MDGDDPQGLDAAHPVEKAAVAETRQRRVVEPKSDEERPTINGVAEDGRLEKGKKRKRRRGGGDGDDCDDSCATTLYWLSMLLLVAAGVSALVTLFVSAGMLFPRVIEIMLAMLFLFTFVVVSVGAIAARNSRDIAQIVTHFIWLYSGVIITLCVVALSMTSVRVVSQQGAAA